MTQDEHAILMGEMADEALDLAMSQWLDELPTGPPVKQWKTRDGQVLLVADMKDSHLLNADRVLQERANYLLDEIESRGLRRLATRNGAAATPAPRLSFWHRVFGKEQP